MFDHVCMTLGFFTELKLRYYIWGAFHAKKEKKDENYRKRGFYWLLGPLHKKIGWSVHELRYAAPIK